MISSIRRHASPALLISLIALFAAVGGVAYAVKKAPKNSVVSKSIKGGAVRNADIGDAAVTETKLADGAVTTNKLADGAVATNKLANDAVTGAKVANGSLTNTDISGGVPVSGYEIVTGPVVGGTGNKNSILAVCTGGKRLVGGGYSTGGVNPNVLHITTDAPLADGVTWRVDSENSDGADSYNIQAFAVCVNAVP